LIFSWLTTLSLKYGEIKNGTLKRPFHTVVPSWFHLQNIKLCRRFADRAKAFLTFFYFILTPRTENVKTHSAVPDFGFGELPTFVPPGDSRNSPTLKTEKPLRFQGQAGGSGGTPLRGNA
jgi:hypothetical protein